MDWLSLFIGLAALAIFAGAFIAISGGNGPSDCDGGCKQGRHICECRDFWDI